MNSTSKLERRPLTIEALSSRIAFAALEFHAVDSPAVDVSINSDSTIPLTQQLYRQISVVSDKSIKTVGLHPQGRQLLSSSHLLQLPNGAVDISIQQSIDSDSAFGYAAFDAGRTEAILWIRPELAISLGDTVPLGAYQWPNQNIDIAFETGSSINVLRFGPDGTQLNSVILDGSKYAEASASSLGLVMLGAVNDRPVTARISAEFTVHEVELQMPSGATFAITVGLGTWNDASAFIGSVQDSRGETRIVRWDLQGASIYQSDLTGIWALKSSGKATLIETDQSRALIVHDSALASLMGIQVEVPVTASQLAVVSNRGITTASFTDIFQLGGEIFLGIAGTDSQQNATYGVVAGSLTQFPSPWMNRAKAADVNLDNRVSALDALAVIRELNLKRSRTFTAQDLSLDSRVDVNGNGSLSALDALSVIAALNRARSGGSGEGESGEGQLSADSTEQMNGHSWSELTEEIRKKSRFRT